MVSRRWTNIGPMSRPSPSSVPAPLPSALPEDAPARSDGDAKRPADLGSELILGQPFLKEILDLLDQDVVIADHEGRILFANRVRRQVFAAAKCCAEPSTVAELYRLVSYLDHRGNELPLSQYFFFRALRGESGLHEIAHAYRPGVGKPWPFRASFAPLRSTQGQVLGAVIVSTNLSEQKRAQEETRRLEHTLSAAMRAISEGVLVIDAQGVVIAVNDSFLRMHHFSSREELEADWSTLPQTTEVRDGQDRLVLTEDWPMTRALRGEQGAGLVYQVKRRGQTVCRVECSYYPLRDDAGQTTGAVMISRDVSQDLKLQTQLQESRRALRCLVAKQNRVTEKERKRIARELHDELQQQLGAIRMDVAEMSRLADRDPAAVQALAELTSGIVDQALDATRRIVNDLRPQILDELGLPAALSAIAEQFHRRAHVECEFELIGPEERGASLDPDVATCLFRVAQEALNNVRKHAKATYVYVMLDLSHPQEVHLQVVDDGVGIDPKASGGAKRYGLMGMEERLDALEGHLRVAPGPQGGTCIDARVTLGVFRPI